MVVRPSYTEKDNPQGTFMTNLTQENQSSSATAPSRVEAKTADSRSLGELLLGLPDDSWLPHVSYIVEATGFERQTLWNKYKDSVKWDERTTGMMKHAGRLTVQDGDSPSTLPVVMGLWFVVIDGRLVLFWEATSQVVDFRMVDHWLCTNLPHLFEKDMGVHLSCDAMNFHHCVQHIQRENREKDATAELSLAKEGVHA